MAWKYLTDDQKKTFVEFYNKKLGASCVFSDTGEPMYYSNTQNTIEIPGIEMPTGPTQIPNDFLIRLLFDIIPVPNAANQLVFFRVVDKPEIPENLQ